MRDATLKDFFDTADDLAIGGYHLHHMCYGMSVKWYDFMDRKEKVMVGKWDFVIPIYQALHEFTPNVHNQAWRNLLYELYASYHDLVTYLEADEPKFIFFFLAKRFEQIQNKSQNKWKQKKEFSCLNNFVETADDMAIVAHHLNRTYYRLAEIFVSTHRVNIAMSKFIPDNLNPAWRVLQHELDHLYFISTQDAETNGADNIFYNLDERFKQTQNNLTY